MSIIFSLEKKKQKQTTEEFQLEASRRYSRPSLSFIIVLRSLVSIIRPEQKDTGTELETRNKTQYVKAFHGNTEKSRK